MIRTALLATVFAASAALPALAEDVTVDRAISAASLHEGPLDMVAYYTGAENDALEVVATFAAGNGDAPARAVMALNDGDAVRFALPGYPQALYGFARTGDAVTVSVNDVTGAIPEDTALLEQGDLSLN